MRRNWSDAIDNYDHALKLGKKFDKENIWKFTLILELFMNVLKIGS